LYIINSKSYTFKRFEKLLGSNHHFVEGIDYLNGGENILQHKENAVSWAMKCMETVV